MHHAVFPVMTAIDRKHFLRGREKLQQLIVDSGKRVYIFCGHYHMADDQQIGEVSQYISPAISYQVHKEQDPIQVTADFFGYRIIRMIDQEIETEVVRFDISG